MDSNIKLTRDGAVGILTIDRRDRFNSLDVQTARDLRKVGLQLARDEAVRCLVVRGSGGIFCSGADLKYIRAGGDQKDLGYLSPEARGAQTGFGRHLQTDPRVPARHHLGAAPRPQARHRGRRRRGGGGRLRPGHVL